MRITDISIPENGCKDTVGDNLGIKMPLQLPRLGQVVVLTGANGAGKTRLLTLITNFGNYYQSIAKIDSLNKTIKDNESNNENRTLAIENLEKQLQANPTNFDSLQRAIENQKTHRENSDIAISKAKILLSYWQWFVTEPRYTPARPVSFFPTNSGLINAYTLPLNNITLQANQCTKMGQGDDNLTIPSYLLFIMRRARNAELSKLKGKSSPESDAAIEAATTLTKLVSSLLGEHATLNIDIDDHISLFGRNDFSNTLSDGQKLLLKLAVKLHAQKTDLAEALLFLDEPENHLHPAALNQVIDVLLAEIPSGQIWIATHSVPLIAKLTSHDPACVWFMKDGTLSHAGRKPELVLQGLLGDEQEISQLRNFTDLPAKMAANRYAAECLLASTTVSPRTGDKQQTQMVDALQQTFSDKKIRVLDFGAGQGRLLAELRETGKINEIDYIAFDVTSKSNAACQKEIEAVYGTDGAKDRFFVKVEDVIEKWTNVDMVIMCNVLHEIQPSDWYKTIGPESRLMELIKSDGFLLIVEDQRIPVGENAHDYGFHVLDTLQYQKLFKFSGAADTSLYMKFDADEGINGKAGRLLAHRFAKSLVANFTRETQKEAIIDLYKTAENNMKKLRQNAKQKEPNFLDGQLHAFWMTQYANAAHWLSENGFISFKH